MALRSTFPPLDELERLRKPLSECELLALDYFVENLPPSWEIYIRPHLNGLAPNIVLLNPKRGIAVYEVRDWDIEKEGYFISEVAGRSPVLMSASDGHSVQVEYKNPIPKIDLYKDEIYTLYCPRLPKIAGFGVIVCGVIFPLSTRKQAEELLYPIRKLHGHHAYPNLYPVIGSDTLAQVGEWPLKKHVLSSAFRIDDRIDEMLASDLRRWLVAPKSKTDGSSTSLFATLSSNQRKIVTTRTTTGYRRVRGPAGSGKTLVLAGRAAVLAAEGKRVLVITFNITLINYISELANRFATTGLEVPQITALNFHFWCKRVAQLSGHYGDYQALWKSHSDAEQILRSGMASAATNWLNDLSESEKWDAILVDEGQDIELSWWKALRSALVPGGEALLCADKIQNIYEVVPWTEDEMSGAGFRGAWGSLDESYRLSPALCQLAKRFIDDYLPDLDNQRPEPIQMGFEFKTILKWWQVAPGHAAQSCYNALLDVIEEADVPVSELDLTCIVANDAIGLQVVNLLNGIGYPSIDTFGTGLNSVEKYYDAQRKKLAFFNGKAAVKVTTLHSFKGWESKSLVVHIGRADTPASLSLAYAGITRLRKDEHGCYLTVVSEAPELREFGSKWPVFVEC